MTRKMATVAKLMAAFAVASPIMAAAPLIVRAQGPTAEKLKPGARLEGTTLNLRAGDSVTILDDKGTRTFEGPGTFRVNEASQPVTREQDAMRALLQAQENQRRAVQAVTRGKKDDLGPEFDAPPDNGQAPKW